MEQITNCQKYRSYLAEADIWRWMIGLGRALKALHGMKIFHRDMKSANVFLTNTPTGRIAKLGDFNVSTVAKKGLCLTQTGTPYYASPEIWRDMPYDGKSDMWGLGCVIYEAAALRPPFRAEDMEGLAHKVCVGRYHRIPPIFSNELSDVIGLLLQVNPRHRPTPAQFLWLPLVHKHAVALDLAEDAPCESSLLSTIKVPRKLIDFQTCLPLPKYEDNTQFDENDIEVQRIRDYEVDASPCNSIIAQSPDVQQRRDGSDQSHPKVHTPPKSSEPSAKRGRAQLPNHQRRAAGGQSLARCRSDAVLPRKRRDEAGNHHAQVERDDHVRARDVVHESPQGRANLLPRIQLNQFAPSKALPKGLRLKLPRIASCPGQLV